MMKQSNRGYGRRSLLAAAMAASLAGEASAAVVAGDLQAALAGRGPAEMVPVLIGLADRIDPTQFRGQGRRERAATLVRALRDKADQTQAAVIGVLQARGARQVRSLWVNNTLAAEVPAGLIPVLETLPGIESIRTDALVQAPVVTAATAATPEWNLNAIGAPAVWALGYTGAGTVVASMDTGVDVNHPDLQGSWRGGANSWFDPNGQHATPYDASGHGTQTMGVLVGGSAGGTAIGVAPGARWIAVKIFNDAGSATLSGIHRGFQWLLDPDGDPATDDAPDVVNNSWGLANAGGCSLEFNNDIQILKAAGINVAFAGGNYGPASLTSISPANNPGGFGVGAVDAAGGLASFSSRGSSACDGGFFPKLTAPGASVKSSTLSLGGSPRYSIVSGTSFAAPHVAGALALLLQAFPDATVDTLEAALMDNANDLGTVGADNGYGYGVVDVLAAYEALAANPPAPPPNQFPVANNDTATTRRGTAVTINVAGNDTDADGSIDLASVTIVAKPKYGTATAKTNGTVVYAPKSTFRGTDSFGYTVKDNLGAVSNKATVTVTVTR